MMNITGTTQERLIASDHIAAALRHYQRGARRLALVGSWIIVARYIQILYETNQLAGSRGAVVAAVVAVAAATLFRWDLWQTHGQNDLVGLVWALAVVGVLTGIPDLADPGLRFGAYLIPVVTAAALLAKPRFVAIVGGIAIAGYVLPEMPFPPDDAVGLAIRVAVFALIIMAVIGVRVGVERLLLIAEAEMLRIDHRIVGLQDREDDVASIYEISRMIGSGGSLHEVLPRLVGRVAEAVDATVGGVLLWSGDEERLKLVQRVWVHGHSEKAPAMVFQLSETGHGQRVFISGEPYVDNFVNERDTADPLLTSLGVRQVAMVPLDIERHTIGVLIIADKRSEAFTTQDTARLTALAGPTALVVRQIARYEEAMQQSDRLEEIATMKTDFVSVVSHELRTPLTSIIGSLATLQRPELLPPNPNAQELVATAERQAQRLRTLIEDLLVVSRLDNRALPVRPTAIEITAFLHDTVSLVSVNDTTTVTISTDPDVPILHSDPDHLARIVTNLVSNAVRYGEGSKIGIETTLADEEVHISVVDHGPGVPFDRRDRVFQPFTQLENLHTRQRGGTGLGLSIVAGLAATLGGRVRYEPTIGGGATFVLTLPLRFNVSSPSR
jgi:signal transduction histidine kinase